MSRTWLVLTALLFLGCAATSPGDGDSRLQVVLDPALKELGPQQINAWKLYGLAKARVIEQMPDGLEDYSIELGSREALVRFWADERAQEGRERSAYLDALVEIQRAGHLDEYVLATLAQPGWTVPFETLDLDAFAAWRSQNLPDHRVETHAAVGRDGASLSPAVPGADLPSLEELASNEPICAALPRASSAYAAWREQERKLPGVALTGRDRDAFVAALRQLRASGATAGRSVTWVSSKAADLSFVVGFCEADRGNMSASVAPLETAIRLQPLFPMWRLELANSLTALKRFDEALREIELTISQTEDRCTLGGAWRRKGFLGIERGQLDEAERAYRKSLEYDSESEIARSELETIASERAARKGASGPYTPPPTAAPTTKRCPRS